MTEECLLSEYEIKDGILHDQNLQSIDYNGNILSLDFSISVCENNYSNQEFLNKYKNFKKCEIKCILDNEADNCVKLETSINKRNNYQTKIMQIEDFLLLLQKRKKKENNADCYDEISITPNQRAVDIAIDRYSTLKYKSKSISRYIFEIHPKKIEFIWE